MNRSRWILALSFFGVIFGGALSFWLVEDGWSFLDALYMTVISVTTVGYGEVHELSSAGRVVAMVVLLAGLGVFGLVIQQVTSYAVGGALGNAVERKRMTRKVAAMSGHTVICGMGSRGQSLAAGMEPGSYVAIERDVECEVVKNLKQRGGVAFIGNAMDAGLLKLAGVKKAAQVVVVVGADEANLQVARGVRHYLGRESKTRVVAAIEEYASRDWFEDKLQRLGIEPIGLREQSLLVLARKLAMELVGVRSGPSDQPLRITVQSSEAALGEVLRVLVMVMQLGSQKPEITVFGCSRDFVSLFKARFPGHDLCCGISWEEGEFGSLGLSPQSPHLALFAMDSNLRSIELADRHG
jgi:voltage-gated potassium channel Kch